MDSPFRLIPPKLSPPLDDRFKPAALANRAFRREVGAGGASLVIGLRRDPAFLSRFETRVFSEDHPQAAANLFYVERLVKFLLWQRGAYEIEITGPSSLVEQITQSYAEGGERKFDAQFMGTQVYERDFRVFGNGSAGQPGAEEGGRPLGGNLNGCRIGFDLGASDRKVSAVVDGEVVFSEEVVWTPATQADPDYHYGEILAGLKAAEARLPRLDAIGGSSAGIFIDNRPMVASLFRGIPKEKLPEVRSLFLRISQEMDAPLEVINDGDVTALAGSMSLEDNPVLGIAMGSSQAAGYVDRHGHILGWLNELAFAPVDYSLEAPLDEWSGDRGCGSTYFSQQCVFRLAPRAGIHIPENLPDAGKLRFVQEKLESGHPGAQQIWESIGIYLGYALAHYADFYDLKHVLIPGRCTSGRGGSLILEGARSVLREEFPDLADSIHLQLPDERSRRVGQAIAAASLPKIDQEQ
ncbi:MAG TPA: ROK family protein [Anaerolineales bacterium]|nr:ROK family protein [Anaerolineales bacterium]